MNAALLATESLEKYGDYLAYHFEGRDYYTRGQLHFAAQLARFLHDRGVRPDDPVVLLMPNCPETLAGFHAVWRLGAIITPITPQLGPREIAYVLKHSEAKAVITVPELVDRVKAAWPEAPALKHLLVFGPSDTPGAQNILPEPLQAHGVEKFVPRDKSDVAFLLYTSGTTGNPKGVLLTHGNVIANHRAVASTGRLKERSWTVLTLPLSHSYGVMIMNVCYVSGCSAVVLPKFDPAGILSAVEKFRVTRFAMVPTMLVRLVNFPDVEKFDVSSLEIVHSGAAPLPNEIRVRFEERFRCRVFDNYGQSESSPSLSGYHESERIRPGSVGHALPGITIEIQDPKGQPLPPFEPGEICARGPNIMKGYLKNDEATREALRGGWLHTGDVGYLDNEGYLFITDRMKDIIIKGAENISPREIEEALYEHPAVDEVAVIGVPDSEYGETICAVVSAKANQSLTQDDLTAHLNSRITKFKTPSHYIFREALPKNANGKLDRKMLRAELKQFFAPAG